MSWLFCCVLLTHIVVVHRRKEKSTKEPGAKKRKAAAGKKLPAKKSKITDGDEELARQISRRRESARDRDATKAKSKKAAALAALKKEKKIQQQQKVEESSDDSLDFGDDEDEDSDDDYAEESKPWQQKGRPGKSTVSRLDKGHDSGDDMDIDDDDDDDAPPAKAAKKPGVLRAPAVEADVEDFVKATIPRRRLARWCNEPYFDAAVLDCFVRLFIGEDDKGEKVYRLCEIVDVTTTPKTYKFPIANKNDKPITTNKLLRLKFGDKEKEFPMILVSDTPPTELDVLKYKSNQKNLRLEILSKRRANKLRRVQDELVMNYTYTTEDIERNLQARRKQGKSFANLGLEQTKMAIAVQAARDSVYAAERRLNELNKSLLENTGDETSLKQEVDGAKSALEEAKQILQAKEAEGKRLKDTVEGRKVRLAHRTKDQNWAKVNERALQANQRADREATKQKETTTLSGSVKKEEFNPYARRKVKPKILWEVGQRDEDKGGEEAKGEEKKENRDEPVRVLTDAPGLVQESTEKGAALSESHQFAIDEEGLAQSSALSGLGLGTRRGSPDASRIRRGLSLSDYLERKANGEL